jgi:hypothetical protein
MQTITELITDIIANPAAYAGAFPVTERQVEENPWNQWNLLRPELEHSSDYLRERFRQMFDSMDRPADFSYGLPGVGHIPAATATGMAIQQENENAYSLPPRGRPAFPDINGPSVDLSGAQLTPEQIDYAREVLRRNSARIDNVGPGESVWVVPTPFNRDSVAQRISEAGQRRVDQAYWGDGQQLPRGPSPDMVIADEMQPFGCDARPDHYRVSPARCACSFASIYRNDMDEHIDDTLIEGSDGVPKRWKVCERCGASALCREVVVAHPTRMRFHAAFDPTEPPVGPSIERQYHCDSCVRGIREARGE